MKKKIYTIKLTQEQLRWLISHFTHVLQSLDEEMVENMDMEIRQNDKSNLILSLLRELNDKGVWVDWLLE